MKQLIIIIGLLLIFVPNSFGQKHLYLQSNNDSEILIQIDNANNVRFTLGDTLRYFSRVYEFDSISLTIDNKRIFFTDIKYLSYSTPKHKLNSKIGKILRTEIISTGLLSVFGGGVTYFVLSTTDNSTQANFFTNNSTVYKLINSLFIAGYISSFGAIVAIPIVATWGILNLPHGYSLKRNWHLTVK
jgi:hypothetical protein